LASNKTPQISARAETDPILNLKSPSYMALDPHLPESKRLFVEPWNRDPATRPDVIKPLKKETPACFTLNKLRRRCKMLRFPGPCHQHAARSA
jgi:hypothetical protein